MNIVEKYESTNTPAFFFAKGYCKERIMKLDFYRLFTEEEKAANLEFANSHSDEEVKVWADNNAKETHERLMKVASLFKTYDVHQFSPETSTIAHYNSDWDLFWYSNKGWNHTEFASYFSLSFNLNRTERQNRKLFDEIKDFLSASGAVEGIECRVAYKLEWDETKIAEEASYFANKLKGKTVLYAPWGYSVLGTVRPVDIGYGFFKTRAKTKYYPMSNVDVVNLGHEIFPDEKLNFALDHDAVFLPGTIHGCTDELYIIYENPQANEGKGSIEIEVVDYRTLLEIYEKTGDNAEEFFGIMPDYFHGKWYYCDNSETDEEKRRDYEDYLRLYHQADFIEGTDGDLTDELNFIINWAKKQKTGGMLKCRKSI